MSPPNQHLVSSSSSSSTLPPPPSNATPLKLSSAAKGKGRSNSASTPKASLDPSTSTSSTKTPNPHGRPKKIKGPYESKDVPVAVELEGEQGGQGGGGAGEWGSSLIAGSAVPKLAPVFTRDASHFFLSLSSSIRIHSSLTSQPISTLSSPSSSNGQGHTAPITAYLVNPLNPLQLVTASLDATIKVWDFLDASLLRTIPCPGPVTHLCVGTEGEAKGVWFGAVETKAKAKKAKGEPTPSSTHSGPQASIWRLSILSSTPRRTSSNTPLTQSFLGHSRIGKIRPCSSLLISPSGTYLVALAGPKAYCINTRDYSVGFSKFVSPENLTCGAFHPKEDWFVTGDTSGVVRLWYCLGEMESNGSAVGGGGVGGERMVSAKGEGAPASAGGPRKTPTTTLHWHSHAVSTVAFNSAGTSILSGGEEGVLVVWSVATSGKEFAPRLGGPLVSIAVREGAEGREEEVWVGLEDGSLKRLGGDGRGGRVVKGGCESSRIQPANSSSLLTSSTTPLPFAYHPLTSSVLLPSSHPSSLQFYSPELQTSILELEVSPSNRVSRTEDKVVEPARVERAVFSSGAGEKIAEYMATSEKREEDEEEGGEEERVVKVWRWDEGLRSYTLTTRLPNPHPSNITSLSFSPVPVPVFPADKTPSLLLLSTGEDGTARVWREKRVLFKSGKVQASFQPHTLFSHRNLPIHDSTWAPDASLLALAQGSVVTLWDPLTSVLRGTLSCSEFAKTPKGSITKVEFVGEDGRWLVGTGAKKGVVVWDLVKGSVHWALPDQAVDQISIHPTSSVFTISDVSLTAPLTTFTIFSTSTATPIRTRTVPYKVRSLTTYPSSSTTDAAPSGPVASTSTAAPVAEDSSFSLLVVSSTWDVLLVGDNLPTRSSASDSAQAINLASSAATPIGRSLFDEIFGPSSSDKEVTRVKIVSEQWKSLDDLFDAPAQVLPGMGMVFGEVLDGLLPKRKDGEQLNEEEEEEEMEVDEEREGGKETEKGEELKTRVVGEAEMDVLVGLFKEILSSPAPPPPPPTPKQLNGKLPSTPKINGSSHPPKAVVNGHASTPSRTPLTNGKAPSAPSSLSKTVDVSMDSPASSAKGTPSGGGRKRKTEIMVTTTTPATASLSTSSYAPAPREAGIDTLSPTPSRAPSYVEREEAPPENPAPSVLNFSRDEYRYQRKIYATSYLLGWCVGSPEAGFQLVKSVERTVARLTGNPRDRKAERRRLRLLEEEEAEETRARFVAAEEERRNQRAEES
ncbi:hypothetical protein BDY24DRAFT_437908 [Mrakia frigida]|uniref:WD40 repeat domain-containing protein n=1 Tax=Mrakia frigida TaxID=29902 RepID=UPI003FCBFE50